MKKGQGLSLTTIIVAVLALIVLVVLVAIFTGRIAIFEKGISEEARAELVKMQIKYGSCKPTVADERDFLKRLDAATSLEAKEAIKDGFEERISFCKEIENEVDCEDKGCDW